MIYTPLTNRALRIAYEAHAGQLDKCGIPYVFHPYHLAEQMPGEATTCAALLHDVVEDTDVTLDELARSFPADVVDAVRLLTHEKSVPYLDYVRAIAANPIARTVKRADLLHNLDSARFAGHADAPEPDIARRREKYTAALAILEKE